MNITGSVKIGGIGSQPIALQRASGAFNVSESGRYMTRSENSGNQPSLLNLNAASNWTGSTSSNGSHSHTANSAGAHTHTITSTTSTTIANNSTVNSIYGKSNTVQTPSVFVKVKTRAK